MAYLILAKGANGVAGWENAVHGYETMPVSVFRVFMAYLAKTLPDDSDRITIRTI